MHATLLNYLKINQPSNKIKCGNLIAPCLRSKVVEKDPKIRICYFTKVWSTYSFMFCTNTCLYYVSFPIVQLLHKFCPKCPKKYIIMMPVANTARQRYIEYIEYTIVFNVIRKIFLLNFSCYLVYVFIWHNTFYV